MSMKPKYKPKHPRFTKLVSYVCKFSKLSVLVEGRAEIGRSWELAGEPA